MPLAFKIVYDARPNSFAFETSALIKPSGFREYDARWWFGHPGSEREPDLNLIGVQALGMGLGTLIQRLGAGPDIVTGHDFRSYSHGDQAGAGVGPDGGRRARQGCRAGAVADGLFRAVRARRAVGRDGHRLAQRERLDRREDGRAATADLRSGRDVGAARHRARRRLRPEGRRQLRVRRGLPEDLSGRPCRGQEDQAQAEGRCRLRQRHGRRLCAANCSSASAAR